MSAASPAVVSVIGRDQKGVVSAVSTYLAKHGANVEKIEQTVMEGLFIMTMVVDLADLDLRLDQLVLDLKSIGDDMQMEVTVRLHGEKARKKIAVLVSREPHCLETLAESHRTGGLDADIALVLSNHQDLAPLAERYGMPFRFFPSTDKRAHMDFILSELGELAPDLVVLARYMQILPSDVVKAYKDRVLNIHPSLLPHYPGANAYQQAYDAGVRVCGCTAHVVTEDLDEGPIIFQDVFRIAVAEHGVDDIRKRGQELEAEVLHKAVQFYVRDEIVIADGKILFRPGRLA